LLTCLPTLVSLDDKAPKFIKVSPSGAKIVIEPKEWDKPGDYLFTVLRQGDVGAEGFIDRTYFKMTILEPPPPIKP
jgi:hypothetical protein